MTVEELIAPNDVPFAKNILENPNFEFIRSCGNYILSLEEREFAIEFDYVLTKCYTLPIPDNDFKEDKYIEKIFLGYLDFKVNKGIVILDNYFEHLDSTGRKPNQLLEDSYDELHFKRDFIKLKIRKTVSLEDITDLEKSFNTISSNKKRSTAKPLIQGKKFNISDRYYIACNVFNIEKTLNNMGNIGATEKHILLSHILGCNQQTARELYNGTHQKRTSVQEDIVNPYLKKIKGE